MTESCPIGTGGKLNVHKTSRTSSERLMYVQFTSCVYWGLCIFLTLMIEISSNSAFTKVNAHERFSFFTDKNLYYCGMWYLYYFQWCRHVSLKLIYLTVFYMKTNWMKISHVCIEWVFTLKFSRSSHPEVFLGKIILKMCTKFTGEHPCRSVISIKLLLKFPVNLSHIFRTPFHKNTYRGLLLVVLTIINTLLETSVISEI